MIAVCPLPTAIAKHPVAYRAYLLAEGEQAAAAHVRELKELEHPDARN